MGFKNNKFFTAHGQPLTSLFCWSIKKIWTHLRRDWCLFNVSTVVKNNCLFRCCLICILTEVITILLPIPTKFLSSEPLIGHKFWSRKSQDYDIRPWTSDVISCTFYWVWPFFFFAKTVISSINNKYEAPTSQIWLNFQRCRSRTLNAEATISRIFFKCMPLHLVFIMRWTRSSKKGKIREKHEFGLLSSPITN